MKTKETEELPHMERDLEDMTTKYWLMVQEKDINRTVVKI